MTRIPIPRCPSANRAVLFYISPLRLVPQGQHDRDKDGKGGQRRTAGFLFWRKEPLRHREMEWSVTGVLWVYREPSKSKSRKISGSRYLVICCFSIVSTNDVLFLRKIFSCIFVVSLVNENVDFNCRFRFVRFRRESVTNIFLNLPFFEVSLVSVLRVFRYFFSAWHNKTVACRFGQIVCNFSVASAAYGITAVFYFICFR